MSRQLVLKVGLSDLACFDNFHPGPNREAVAAAREVASGRPGLLYLHGPSGTGKSHLLYAALKQAEACGRRAAYTSRAPAQAGTADWLELSGHGLACVDDIGQSLSSAEAAALFSLYESSRAHGGSLVLASHVPPSAIDWEMADLRSRMLSGLVYRLLCLDEPELEEALRLRAGHRGIHLSDDVVRFVLRRYERSPASLFRLLDRIDSESLARKKPITVPFLRALDAGDGDPAGT